MINITQNDINKLERIGAGTFGTVYQKGDKAYKIYHELVKTDCHSLVKNPSLKYKELRLKRMMKIGKKLKHTDLVQDTLFVDGKFAGVVTPYYDGETLVKTIDEPIGKKIDIAKQLIRNTKELTHYHIYPLDYKLNNIMLVNGEVRIIDLDDYRTKVKPLLCLSHARETIYGLDETIKTYFNDSSYFPFTRDLRMKLDKRIKLDSCEYKEVEDYVEEKAMPHNYIFINEDVDVSKNMELLKNQHYRVIYVYNGYHYDEIETDINKVIDDGVNIYDIAGASNLKKYIRSISYNECIGVQEDKILTLSR